MVLDIFTRSLNENEIAEALSLVWSVFMEYEAPDYSKEGVEEFYKSIHDQTILRECHPDKLTVNSSPYAVPVYYKLGFCDVDKEQVVNGLRFTPMEYGGWYRDEC